jgi:hypothetical protein
MKIDIDDEVEPMVDNKSAINLGTESAIPEGFSKPKEF